MRRGDTRTHGFHCLAATIEMWLPAPIATARVCLIAVTLHPHAGHFRIFLYQDYDVAKRAIQTDVRVERRHMTGIAFARAGQ